MQEAEECKPLEALDLTRVSSFSGFSSRYIFLFCYLPLLICFVAVVYQDGGFWYLINITPLSG
jgi:hypothetical protein